MSAMNGSHPLRPALTAEEEDTLIQTRLANDERPFRRLVRKFHTFSNLIRSSGDSDTAGLSDTTPVDEARNGFLLELSSFQLLLKKSALTCQAETRQVLEYQREKGRLEQEQTVQREQIVNLKTALEIAQISRRRKMEYDQVAERVNTLPTRMELEQAIAVLESDISTIQEDHEQLKRNVQARRERLEQVQKDIQFMNRVGRENVPEEDVSMTAAEDETDEPSDSAPKATSQETEPNSPAPEEATPSRLNPDARPFRPSGTPLRESVLRRVHASSANVSAAPSPAPPEEGEEKEDIEMGEVSEVQTEKDKGRRKIKEELEEGEASDQSSELSEPPEV